MALVRRGSGSFDSVGAPPSPRGLAGARSAELAARRDREADEANALLSGDGDMDNDNEEEDNDEDEDETTTQVFEVELGGSSPWATAFLECASEGDLVPLTKLLDDGKVELDDVDVDGFTALMIAAAEAQNHVAMELLRRGADVAIRTHEMRSTALHFAAKSGAAQVVQAICDQDPQRVDAQNLDGDTPLVWACTEGRVDAVRVLLDHHANVNVVSHRAMSALICSVMLRERDGSDDDEPTELEDAKDVAASDADRAEIVRLLLRKNPKLVNYQDRDGSTAMHLAASHGYIECVKVLLEFGADITLRNAIGQTPLEEAEETGIKATSGQCVTYLRDMWKRLEDEAAARMMAMLEMEESSTGPSAHPRSARKANKKKQKKAKQRRVSKANSPNAVGSTDKAAEEKTTASSDDGSSDEEHDAADKKASPAVEESEAGGVNFNPTPPAIVDDTAKETGQHPVLPTPDGGVWMTVGRKHNQYLSQRVAEEARTDDVSSAVEAVEAAIYRKAAPVKPQTKDRQVASPSFVDGSSKTPMIRTERREFSKSKKVVPAQSKAKIDHVVDSRISTGPALLVDVNPSLPPSATELPPVARPFAPSLSISSPFSTFQSLHGAHRLYERYDDAATRAPGGGDMPNSPSMWRASSQSSSSNTPFSLGPATAQTGTSNASTSAIWRYTSPTLPLTADRASLFSSRRWVAPDRIGGRFSPDSASDQLLRSLSCGLCGELVSDNLQCGSSAGKCFQLYCVSCLTRVVGTPGATPQDEVAFHCVKCRLPTHSREMQRNEFAQAQAAALALATTSRSVLQQKTHSYDDLRALLHRTSDRIQAADVEPLFLVPGANLSSLSVGQLDALEELHLVALQQIMQARLANARAMERLRIEEWLKTQRDVFQCAPPP